MDMGRGATGLTGASQRGLPLQILCSFGLGDAGGQICLGTKNPPCSVFCLKDWDNLLPRKDTEGLSHSP